MRSLSATDRRYDERSSVSSSLSSIPSKKILFIVVCCITMLLVYKVYVKPLDKFARVIGNSDADVTDIVDDDDDDDDKLGRQNDMLHSAWNLDDLPSVTYAEKYVNDGQMEIDADAKRCVSRGGLYLGPDDIPIDCTELCNSKDFRYKYVNENSFVVDRSIMAKQGAYCVPTHVVNCNTNTSRLVKTFDSWKCHPKTSLFGGEDGCEIVGCNGYLKDNLTGRCYRNRIPTTLTVGADPENELIERSSSSSSSNNVPVYRFQCTDTEVHPDTGVSTLRAVESIRYDFMHNKLIASEFSRFDRVRNGCAAQIFNAVPQIVPNFTEGTCTCIEGLHHDKKDDTNNDNNNNNNNNNNDHNGSDNGRSDDNDYKDGTMSSLKTIKLHQRCSPCLSGWSKKDSYTRIGRACRKAFDDSRIDPHDMLLPCGTRTFDSKQAACVNGKIYISGGLSHFARNVLDNEPSQ